jgi:hypothetical protein
VFPYPRRRGRSERERDSESDEVGEVRARKILIFAEDKQTSACFLVLLFKQ